MGVLFLGVAAGGGQEVAGHPQVEDESVAALQVQGEKFAPPVDGGEGLPLHQAAKLLRPRAGDDLGVVGGDPLDAAAPDLGFDDPLDGFDFWQFWHGALLFSGGRIGPV